jgi:hypothetical protein
MNLIGLMDHREGFKSPGIFGLHVEYGFYYNALEKRARS